MPVMESLTVKEESCGLTGLSGTAWRLSVSGNRNPQSNSRNFTPNVSSSARYHAESHVTPGRNFFHRHHIPQKTWRPISTQAPNAEAARSRTKASPGWIG